MDVFRLEGEARETGKHAVRALRKEEKVPCVLYGGKVQSLPFSASAKAIGKLVFSHEQHRIELAIGGKRYDCILKDVAYHPVSRQPAHADFLVLQRNQPVTLQVPIRFIGTPVGQIEQGGETTIAAHDLTVTCLPNDIPAHIDVDISGLHIGESLHVSDLNVEGLTLEDTPAKTIASVLAPRIEVEAVPEAVTEKVEEEETSEGESEKS